MSRVFKFRAWNKSDGGLFQVYAFNNDFVWLNGGPGVSQFPHSGFEVMQYTGLTDQKLRQIYEGDILSELGMDGVVKVIWRDGGFMYENSDGSGYVLYQDMTSRCEVIGNIYENPELLTPAPADNTTTPNQ